MKAYPGQSGPGLVLYDAWAVPGVITDMCCLLKFTDHYPNLLNLLGQPCKIHKTRGAAPGPAAARSFSHTSHRCAELFIPLRGAFYTAARSFWFFMPLETAPL